MYKARGYNHKTGTKVEVEASSKDDYHKLDGNKLDQIELHSSLRSRQDVDELMDFLKIAKYTLE